MKLVAIVVPLSTRPELTRDEETSLRHLDHHLGKYDRYLIAPEGMNVRRPGYELAPFSKRYFGSMKAHGRLHLSEEFYTRFADYKYILMYHTDALVFSDRLEEWCARDLDLVGAPWMKCADSPWVERNRVGNGGFVLIKVQSFLNVMHSDRPTIDPEEYWRQFCEVNPPYRQWLHLPRKYLKRLHAFNNVRWEMRWWTSRKGGTENADYFWSDEAVKYWPDFKIASFEEGLDFAFEVSPRECFELNQRRMPFGAHAWPRYDRAFWEPHLLQ